MSLDSSVQNKTYAAAQISTGTVVPGTSDYTYTETGTSPLSGTATINTYNPATNAITYTISASGLTAQGTGTVIGNGTSGFLISGTVTVPFLGTQTGIVYITNTAAQQPGTGGTVHVPFESANIVYTPACYCRGTLIRTPGGKRAVEELAEGDLVDCVSGTPTPVRWVGRRSYGGRFLRANPGLQPVRFRAGSLGPGLPSRDLLVSRRHAMMIDGVLVPAELLVNGTTVVLDGTAGTVEYFHVELARHDAVWAEDAPSETFVDDGSRGVFHNAAEWAQANPERDRAPVLFCAERVESGPELAAIRRRLDGLAGRTARAA